MEFSEKMDSCTSVESRAGNKKLPVDSDVSCCPIAIGGQDDRKYVMKQRIVLTLG